MYHILLILNIIGFFAAAAFCISRVFFKIREYKFILLPVPIIACFISLVFFKHGLDMSLPSVLDPYKFSKLNYTLDYMLKIFAYSLVSLIIAIGVDKYITRRNKILRNKKKNTEENINFQKFMDEQYKQTTSKREE